MRSMNRNLALVFACFLIFVLGSASQSISQPQTGKTNGSRPAADEIKHLLSAQVDAWNKGDLEGFMAGYWNSPDLTFFSGGNVAHGWQAALERYQRNYQSTGKEMGHLEFQDLNIDQVGEQAAVVRGSWHLTMSDGKTPHGLFTLILKRFPGGWKIVHDHTSAAEEK